MMEKKDPRKKKPLTIAVGGLYKVNKFGGRFSGKEVKVVMLLPGKKVMVDLIDEHGEHHYIMLNHHELFWINSDDSNVEEGLVVIEAATVIPRKERVTNAMEKNEEICMASRVFVREMALIALDDDESLFAVLNAAKKRLTVEYADGHGHDKVPGMDPMKVAAKKRKAVVDLVDSGDGADSQ